MKKRTKNGRGVNRTRIQLAERLIRDHARFITNLEPVKNTLEYCSLFWAVPRLKKGVVPAEISDPL